MTQPSSLLETTDFEDIRDIYGRRIMPGDLLRSYYFTAAVRRRKCYLHHYVIRSDKNWSVGTGPYLRGCHMEELASGKPLTAEHGFRLMSNESVMEIIDGPTFVTPDRNLIYWYERPKRKQVGT